MCAYRDDFISQPVSRVYVFATGMNTFAFTIALNSNFHLFAQSCIVLRSLCKRSVFSLLLAGASNLVSSANLETTQFRFVSISFTYVHT